MAVFCLLVTLLFVLGGLGGLVLGAWIDDARERDLAEREAVLRIHADALTRAERINEAFWNARIALQAEVSRQAERGTGRPGHGWQ
jgi:hypothetical protein